MIQHYTSALPAGTSLLTDHPPTRPPVQHESTSAPDLAAAGPLSAAVAPQALPSPSEGAAACILSCSFARDSQSGSGAYKAHESDSTTSRGLRRCTACDLTSLARMSGYVGLLPSTIQDRFIPSLLHWVCHRDPFNDRLHYASNEHWSVFPEYTD